ncbi:MAG: hypothetical protein ABR502_12605, partial [Chitinophagaceae bacterium]
GEDQYKDKENKEESNKTENISSEDHTPVVAEELPGVLTKEIFSELATYRDERCISVFLGHPSCRCGSK